jgi:UDP-glucose 4-epimerase
MIATTTLTGNHLLINNKGEKVTEQIRRALVTGGCGFIGSNIVHRLVNDGWKVDVVDDMSEGRLENLDGIKFRVVLDTLLPSYEAISDSLSDKSLLVIQGDIESPYVRERISRGCYDVVFHLAANPRVQYSVENPAATTDVNCTRSLSIIESILKSTCPTRLVFSSTCAVYGDVDDLPTSEATRKEPLSPYGLQKSYVEDYIKIAARLHGLDGVSLRYFNVYGPRQYGDSAYATAITSWCSRVNDSQPLRSDGDGEQTRDLVFVEDVVHANILAATSKMKFDGEKYNIGSGESISNNNILKLFKEKFDNIEVVNAPSRPGDVKHTLADISLAKRDLGYFPQTPFEKGLQMTWDWWGFNQK